MTGTVQWDDIETDPNAEAHALGLEPPRPRSSWQADELMAEHFPEPRFAVPGVLAQGLTLLAGAPKLGKSWLALNLGVAIASGGMALGSIPVAEGDVLYLALEDNGRRLQSRLKMVLGDDPAPPRLTLATECPPLHDGGRERITDWLSTHPDARLVIVDVFARVRGATARGTDRYESDYGAVAALKNLADEYDIAILLLHHTRKMEATDFLDAVSGSQGLAGAADAVAILARSRGQATAALKVTGRDIAEQDLALDFDADTGTWKILDGPAVDHLVSDQRRSILEHLREFEGDTPKGIADATGISHDTVKKLVVKMVDADQADTDRNGHYFPLPTVPPVPPVPPTDITAGQDATNRGNGSNTPVPPVPPTIPFEDDRGNAGNTVPSTVPPTDNPVTWENTPRGNAGNAGNAPTGNDPR